MMGLDAAGKTAILYKMKLGEVVSSVPTVGFNVEEVEYKDVTFTFWDVGWRMDHKSLWHHYHSNTQAVIFVIDATDPERVELAR